MQKQMEDRERTLKDEAAQREQRLHERIQKLKAEIKSLFLSFFSFLFFFALIFHLSQPPHYYFSFKLVKFFIPLHILQIFPLHYLE